MVEVELRLQSDYQAGASPYAVEADGVVAVQGDRGEGPGFAQGQGEQQLGHGGRTSAGA